MKVETKETTELLNSSLISSLSSSFLLLLNLGLTDIEREREREKEHLEIDSVQLRVSFAYWVLNSGNSVTSSKANN